jgi:hypothetical protein
MDPLVTYGLLAAWAVHDAEEVATAPRWVRENLPVLKERFPGAPGGLWRALERMDGAEFAAAVGMVGALVAGAAVAGHRSGGRSALYQGVLTAFGAHGVAHLAQAAAFRSYTPGSVTSPLVVVPFTLWARGRLKRAGVLRPVRARDVVTGLAGVAAVAATAHAVALRVTGARPRTPVRPVAGR